MERGSGQAFEDKDSLRPDRVLRREEPGRARAEAAFQRRIMTGGVPASGSLFRKEDF